MKLIESSPLSCRGAMLSSIYERISHRYKMEYHDPSNDKDIGVYLYIGSTHVGTCIRSIIYLLESFIGFSFERDNDKQFDLDKSIEITISLDKIKAMHDENRKARIDKLLEEVLNELSISYPNINLSYTPKENNSDSRITDYDILITVQNPTVDQHVEIDCRNNAEPYLTKIWRFTISDNLRNLLAELMSYDAFKEECPVSFDLTI